MLRNTDKPTQPARLTRRQPPFFVPVCDLSWISAVAQLPGKAMHLACALLHLKRLQKAEVIRLAPSVLLAFGLSRQAGYRCLDSLVTAGLVEIVDRHAGRAAKVRLVGDRAGDSQPVPEAFNKGTATPENRSDGS